MSDAYKGHFDAMVFEEAKQNGKFAYLEAFCFILPRLVSKKRAKVTKKNIVGKARAANAMQLHGRASLADVAKGKAVLTSGHQTRRRRPRRAMEGMKAPTHTSALRAVARATRRLTAGSDTHI